MSELLGIMQKIIQASMEAMKPADMETGTVVSTSPLSVQLDVSMPPIPEAGLILTDAVKPKTVPVQGGGGGYVTVSNGLMAGDKVLMLRVSGGQRYLVLSKKEG